MRAGKKNESNPGTPAFGRRGSVVVSGQAQANLLRMEEEDEEDEEVNSKDGHLKRQNNMWGNDTDSLDEDSSYSGSESGAEPKR